MEYYFGDQLRWAFGFDNPNKAGAFIAALLPLLWLLVHWGWSLRQRLPKGLVVIAASGVLWMGWWLLFKTYSRGGIVAAIAGFLYIGWRERSFLLTRARLGFAIAGLGIAVALFTGTKAAERSTQWIVKSEGSVNNRFELWRGGVRMIAQIPQGVGIGNSGAAYMQWFQPVESETRYRTLVNSYLTFAAEEGIALFGLAIFAASLLWIGSGAFLTKRTPMSMATGCRASLLAFAVAGFFTTTMEDWRVWIPPAVSTLLLSWIIWRANAGLFLTAHKRAFPNAIAASIAISGGVCGALILGGILLAKHEALHIKFHDQNIRITPTNTAPTHAYSVLVDKQVLGEDYGKLLRRLAINLNATVTVLGNASGPQPLAEGGTLIATGERVLELPVTRGHPLILIAPARMERPAAESLAGEAKSILLFNPAFDEDGRVAFWTERCEKKDSRLQHYQVDGVGLQLASAWDQIVEKIVKNGIETP